MILFSSDVVRLANMQENRRSIQTINKTFTRFQVILSKGEVLTDLISNVNKVILCLHVGINVDAICTVEKDSRQMRESFLLYEWRQH